MKNIPALAAHTLQGKQDAHWDDAPRFRTVIESQCISPANLKMITMPSHIFMFEFCINIIPVLSVKIGAVVDGRVLTTYFIGVAKKH